MEAQGIFGAHPDPNLNANLAAACRGIGGVTGALTQIAGNLAAACRGISGIGDLGGGSEISCFSLAGGENVISAEFPEEIVGFPARLGLTPLIPRCCCDRVPSSTNYARSAFDV